MKSQAFVVWLTLSVAASASAACAGDGTNLTCTSRGGGLKVIHLDLAKMQACDDEGCISVKSSGRDMLTYDCVAGKTYCTPDQSSDGVLVVSSAGPWVREDHFSYNKTTGRFRRYGSGMYGDHGTHEFRDDFSGTCVAYSVSAAQAPAN